ncbi:hypothetical protein B9Z51_03450 [Limnohabitans sp. T6-5]|uniref:DUF4139 domain-containing protein n=1 Tax=Limnohabitans sp. T6-5 TaxID=1100724 RepID=UPI000D33D961|nr:DUF4139 domain-containing protein [Limnohabitans sp. T6-5]PUE11373.1 hypothetical protein B9Z51_03450 [Limnohabitans sp. T6-5]
MNFACNHAIQALRIHASQVCKLSLLLFASASWAQSLPTEGTSTIQNVTVYPGVAVIERVAKVPAGTRQLVLSCLSTAFDMSALRVDTSHGVMLGAISAVDMPRSEVPACANSSLDEKITTQEQRIAALRAEEASYDLVLNYLKNLGSNVTPRKTKQGMTTMMAHMQRSGLDASLQQLRVARERETLERDLKPLLSQRERQQSQEQVRQLSLQVTAEQVSELRLVYPVQTATWAPAYRATLDTTQASLQMERLAQVSQNSGEDWRGVSLRLSTGAPRSAPQGPLPRAWTISTRPLLLEGRVMLLAPTAAPAAAVSYRQGTEPVLDFAVQVAQGEYATEFQVPGKVDVSSSHQRVAFSLEHQTWPAKIFVQTSPKLEASAWLKAQVARPDGVWPDGILHLLRDRQTIGQSTWRMGDDTQIKLPFGRDEQVRVQVNATPDQTASAGLLSTRLERRESHHYEIQNLHRTPIELEVLESRPVGTDAQISIEAGFEPAIEPQPWGHQAGIVVWRKTLPASATATFKANYLITHPKDVRISETR